jgi:hypothetical protein
VEGYEHMDCLWATDAEYKVWRRIVRVMRGLAKRRDDAESP